MIAFNGSYIKVTMKAFTATAFATFGIISSFVLQVNPALAQIQVDGYYRSNGTYVEPHQRSAPDGIRSNNYSHPGNFNPNTGRNSGGTYGSGFGSDGSTKRGNSFGF